ncbi:MAG: aldo/keto reductase family protein [Deinococcales bacterium]
MEYRRLGSSGLKVSRIALGGWTTFGASVTDEVLAESIIEKAISGGINFFDQADIYAKGASERLMGKFLKKYNRNNLVISSKCFWPMSEDPNDRGLSRKHIMQSVDGSLKRLDTDYLDIYFCHRFDPDTPLEETVSAMSDLVHMGKILYWGTSEWTAEQIQSAVQLAKENGLVAPVVEQPHYSLAFRHRVEQEIMPTTTKHGVGLVVWSPLGMGVLTGKFDNGDVPGARLSETKIGRELYTPEIIEKVRQLKPIADELGISRTALALGWVLRSSAVSSAIVGATKPEQLDESLSAQDLVLDASTIAKLDAIFTP